MINNPIRIIKLLKPYLVVVTVFIVTGCLLNAVETVLFCKTQTLASSLTIIQSFFNIAAVFSLYACILLPLYLFVGLLKQKLAQIVISVLFSIFVLLEAGLFMYYKQTGVLMGAELIVRPLSEILVTIRNSSNIVIDIVLIVAVTVLLTALPFRLSKIKIFNHFLFSMAGVAVMAALATGTALYQRDANKTVDHYLESKSFHFFSALFRYSADNHYLAYDEKEGEEKIKRDENRLKEYIRLFPDRNIPDWEYPVERPSSEIPDVLSPYFKTGGKQPHIVILIIESLGSYLMGEKGENVSFTPYLDSLANTGLYWKNGLATTPRTFGVVSAILGSVPHGMRGFQFGVMPGHYSLFTLLKENQYATHFFYGGDPNFDSMLDFLTIQEPDHIDNFSPQMKTFRKKKQANWWALYDHVLFEESFKYLQSVPPQQSAINVYLTLTSHDPFSAGDKELKEYYEAKTEKIFAKLDAKQRKYFLPIKDIIVPFTYVDDCVRGFIRHYSQQPDFENTLFIITGDHSYGIHKNDLAHYSVPLIIWAPLLKRSKSFPNTVSHWAIAPSVVSFLQHNYDVKIPDKVAWYSDGLDTSSIFKPSEKVLFLSYERKVNAMVYNQYYFDASNRQLYKIDEALDLESINDLPLTENIHAAFNTLKYVNDYTYHNNRLVKAGSRSESEYKFITGYQSGDTIVCKTPDTIPSIHGIETFVVMPVQKIKDKYEKIKIKLTVDIVINDLLYQDQYMLLNFICSGKDYEYNSKENITKYIADDNIEGNKRYELSVEKEIDVSSLDKCRVYICVTTNEHDHNWRANKKITISNINALILGK